MSFLFKSPYADEEADTGISSVNLQCGQCCHPEGCSVTQQAHSWDFFSSVEINRFC